MAPLPLNRCGSLLATSYTTRLAFDSKALDRGGQGADVGEKYRIGVYSEDPSHLREATAYIRARPDRDRIRVEVLLLTRYVPSTEEHQNRLSKLRDDYCRSPRELMRKHLPKTGQLSFRQIVYAPTSHR